MSKAASIVHAKDGDAALFIDAVRKIAHGTARECRPERLYLIRIDHWFGPLWLNFAGKMVGGVMGIHPANLRVPPFKPSRVVEERMFATPSFDEQMIASPVHIKCRTGDATSRRIEQLDKKAVLVWYSGGSAQEGRGAVMVHLPVVSNTSGFYAGFVEKDGRWQPGLLRHISRGELEGIRSVGAETAVNLKDD
jgi:hypothetical protein